MLGLVVHQAKKKVVLFPEIGWVKIVLSPTRPRKSDVYENIYFLFQKNIHTNKKNSTSEFVRTNLRIFLQTKKDRALCFSTKNIFFKCKLYLKN